MPEEYNPYPLHGQPFMPTVPTAQQEAKEKAREDVLQQVPLLRKVIKRLDNRIGATDSVKQALILAKAYGISKEDALIILDTVRQQLEVERGYILGQIEKLK